LEVNEDGSLHLFCGRASDRLRAWRDEEAECVFETVIIGLTKRLVLVAHVVADTTGYLGSWDFGIAVTGLRGLISSRLVQQGDTWAATPFSEDTYRQTTRVPYERLVKDPDGIVADLTGRLTRALRVAAPIPQ